jgi:hypothetical protein
MTNKGISNPLGLKGWWLALVFWAFFIAELFCIIFIIIYWRDLQSSIEVPKGEAILQAAFGNPIVLGFLRSLLILLTPLCAYLILALSTRVLFARMLRFGGLEIEAITERLNETELDYEKIQEFLSRNDQLTRQLLEQVIDSIKQKGGAKK